MASKKKRMTKRNYKRRNATPSYLLFQCYLCFAATIALTNLDRAIGDVTVTWTPAADYSNEEGEKTTSIALPLSQRYWDEHGIERPDYAKTDEEVEAEMLQRRSRNETKIDDDDGAASSSSFGVQFRVAILFGSAIMLLVGHHAESTYGSPQRVWAETRRTDTSPSRRRVALVRALIYESQPVRVSTLLPLAKRLFEEVTNVDNYSTLFRHTKKTTGTVVGLLRRATRRDYEYFLLYPLAYCLFVRYVHVRLDAGPLVIITTMLYVILSVGLDDNDDGDGTSAYSVFNRGFQRLLGDVDAEALLAQYAGGGAAVAAAGAFRRPEAEVPAEREGPPPPIVREDDDDDEPAPAPPVSRRSGKKARRRNLEERRERQRQRQAAIDMGLVGDELGDVDMVRLMENDQQR